jgi:drug/metabolite transporter (DMT)-like permease
VLRTTIVLRRDASRGFVSSRQRHRLGLMLGLAAAATFGASTPFAKRLLEDAPPQLLAGLLYLGAFLVLAVTLPARRHTREARLRRSDLPQLFGLVWSPAASSHPCCCSSVWSA